jgi:anti-repressor protein
MNELIKIKERDGKQLVSARELYEFLGTTERFSKWFERFAEYGMFIENMDYTPYQMVHPQNGQNITDYAIGLDMAKEISMLQRSEKGKEARIYFISCEKKLKENHKIPQTYSEGLLLASNQAKQIEEQQKQIEEQTPKVDFFDAVAGCKDAIDMGCCAKVLNIGIGRNRLFEFLRNNAILDRNNIPFQRYIDQGLFRTIEQKYIKPDGTTCVNIKSLVFQKGLIYIRKMFLSQFPDKHVL